MPRDAPTNCEIAVADALELAQRVLVKLTVTGSKTIVTFHTQMGSMKSRRSFFTQTAALAAAGPLRFGERPKSAAGNRRTALKWTPRSISAIMRGLTI